MKNKNKNKIMKKKTRPIAKKHEEPANGLAPAPSPSSLAIRPTASPKSVSVRLLAGLSSPKHRLGTNGLPIHPDKRPERRRVRAQDAVTRIARVADVLQAYCSRWSPYCSLSS